MGVSLRVCVCVCVCTVLSCFYVVWYTAPQNDDGSTSSATDETTTNDCLCFVRARWCVCSCDFLFGKRFFSYLYSCFHSAFPTMFSPSNSHFF